MAAVKYAKSEALGCQMNRALELMAPKLPQGDVPFGPRSAGATVDTPKPVLDTTQSDVLVTTLVEALLRNVPLQPPLPTSENSPMNISGPPWSCPTTCR